MKRLALPMLMIIGGLSACQKTSKLVLTNPGQYELSDKTIVVGRSVFPAEIKYFDLENGQGAIPVQFDDMDGDGEWDEVAFEASFGAGESVKLSVVPKDAPTEFVKKTNAYLGHSPERNNEFTSVESNQRPADHVALSTPYLYQFEGPAWESDKVAFRSYFDSRNGKDIFGKTTGDMVAEQIGVGENYHELQDWGMDVLKVGGSLGAGALAMLKNDSVYRLGQTGNAAFRIVTEGPVRSIIELSYEDWNVDSTNYNVTETISIWAGKRNYESEIVLGHGADGDTLVTGIVDLKKVDHKSLEAHEYAITYSHGNQSENHDILGMALLVPDVNFAGNDEAPEEGDGVTNTLLSYLKQNKGAYTYHFFVGWELENKDFVNKDAFEAAVIDAAKNLNQKIDIKIEN